MKRVILLLSVFVLIVGLDTNTYSATVTSTLDISASVPVVCTVQTTPVNFGALNQGTINTVSAAGDVTVSCAAPYNIGLDAGQNLGQNPSNPNFRAVTNGTDYVKYELFQTAFNVDEWGNGGAGNYPFPPLNDTGTGTPQAHTVFGVIDGTSGQSTGQYSDVVNVTVAF